MGKLVNPASIKHLISVPLGARDLFGDIRGACTKCVEHIEKYKSTQQEYTDPRVTCFRGKDKSTQKIVLVYGHTTLNAPDLVRKLHWIWIIQVFIQ